VAALRNDGVIAFGQDALVKIIGDPKLQDTDIRCVHTLDCDLSSILSVDFVFLVTLGAVCVVLVLVIQTIDRRCTIGQGLDQLDRDRTRVLTHNANRIFREWCYSRLFEQ